MPPKGKKQAKASNDDEFDALMKELKQQSAPSKADAKHHTEKARPASAGAAAAASAASATTMEERRLKHKEQRDAAEKKKAQELESKLEQDLRAKRLQSILAQFMSMQRMPQSPFLTAPKTDVSIEEKAAPASALVGSSCVGSMQGWRQHMEDAHVLRPDFSADMGLFCVFDGHGGSVVATASSTVLPALIALNRTADKAEFLKRTYLQLDERLKPRVKDQSGCTAVTVLVTASEVTCASVGDSRALICKKDGTAVPLAHDHKPEVPAERERVEAAGGRIENNRVDGLAMSRAIGDYALKDDAKLAPEKQRVIAVPDVISHTRSKAEDDFLIVACDGVFDVMSNDELCAAVQHLWAQARDAKEEGKTEASMLRRVVNGICARCVAPENASKTGPAAAEGTDNVTFMLVKL